MNAYKLFAWQAGILACLCLAHVTTPAQAVEVDFSALDRLVSGPQVASAASPDFSALDRLIDGEPKITSSPAPCFACLDALCEPPAPDFSALDKLLERELPPVPVPSPAPQPKVIEKPLPAPPIVPPPAPPAPARTQQAALHPMPTQCRNGNCLNPADLANSLSPKKTRKRFLQPSW